MIWELWQNGQYVELAALGRHADRGAVLLVVLAQLAGRRFGIAET
jgi:iron(III) transport system permease protein